MKLLKKTTDYKYEDPDPRILETFKSPGISVVSFHCKEFTSLCPITGQPDYGRVQIFYGPREKCLESKSLKLYLMMYRQYGGFAEQITKKIYDDLESVLEPRWLMVSASFSHRGGISVEVSHGRIEEYKMEETTERSSIN